MKYHFVTSFNSRMYEAFGKDMLRTWVLYLPSDCRVTCWIEGPFPKNLPEDPRFIFKMVDTHDVFKSFVDRFSNVPAPRVPPGNEFRFRYLSFWFKVFALTQTFLNEQYERNETVAWIDADVKLKTYLTKDFLDSFNGEIVWLDRDVPWYAIESGFMLFRRSQATASFMIDLQNIYLTGFLFDLQEWHDGYVLKALSKTYCQRLQILNINKDPVNRDAFKTSALDDFMEHYKGVLKQNGAEKISE